MQAHPKLERSFLFFKQNANINLYISTQRAAEILLEQGSQFMEDKGLNCLFFTLEKGNEQVLPLPC